VQRDIVGIFKGFVNPPALLFMIAFDFERLRIYQVCWLLGLSVRELASFLVETGEMRGQSRRFLLNFFSGDTSFFTKESFYWCFVFSCA